MSANPSGQKSPERLSKALSRLAGWPARLSTAGKAAWAMAAFLTLATVVVWAVFLTEPGHVAPRHAFTPWRIFAVVVLLVLIPAATYQVVRLWLEGDRSRFPEIDFAWNAGLEAIRRSGLSLDEEPLDLGGSLRQVRIAYRTWGELDARGENAVVVCHALTGSADADRWWTGMFGRA